MSDDNGAAYVIGGSQGTMTPRTSIHGVVEIDDTGFWFRGEKIEDAGEAHRAFLEAVYRGEATELRRALETITSQRNRLQEALNYALKGDLDPEDRVIIAQILDGGTLQESRT